MPDGDAGTNPTSQGDNDQESVVHLRGVLQIAPGLQQTGTPEAYRLHPLLHEQHFYTVPSQLLEAVCRPSLDESFEFDANLVNMEFELSKISSDHSQRIGFWNDFPIYCTLLYAVPLQREHLEGLDGLSEKKIQTILNSVNGQIASFSEIACGYAGWLMTNPTFVAELNALVIRLQQEFQTWGTALIGLAIPSNQPPGLFNPTGEKDWNEYETTVLEFCIRWRLQGLAGTRIPIPMRPMMGGQFPMKILPQLMRAGGVFNWPDIFPIFARNELRSLLEHALRSSHAAHLAEWHEIIAASNKAKNRIVTFERRFRLQHFWRLLKDRHPRAFERRIGRIDRAFADYFGVDESSIRADRNAIAKSLGDGWEQSL